MKNTRSFSRFSRSVAAVSVGLLLTTACGGGGDDGNAAPETSAPTDRTEAADPVVDDTDDPGEVGEVSPPVFLLDEEPTVPSGYQPLAARCDSDDDRGASLALAVPEGWELTGSGSAGSGSPFDNKYSLNFTTPDGRVDVEIDPDRFDADGNLLDSEGEPWESYDYEWSSYGNEGEKSGTITFDLLDTTGLADQQVEIFVAERDQDPDQLSATEHRARIELAQIPNFALDGKLMPVSAVVSISHDPDAMTLSADDVAAIIGSFALPTCTREQVYTQLELVHGVDLDGDGKVASIEDILGDAPDIEELLDRD